MTKEQLQEFIQLLDLLKTLYTKPEAAKILGLSQATLNRWISLGIGPSYKKLGDNENGKFFYPITSLVEFYFS